jgi:hypothetical protein
VSSVVRHPVIVVDEYRLKVWMARRRRVKQRGRFCADIVTQ